MEEVDEIIFHSLRTIGCDVEDDLYSVQQLSTDNVIEATGTCLRIITTRDDIPVKLPANMSARFRTGTVLAQALKDLGYRGDVGYQTFLYSNEADIRRVLMFLIEKLPKEHSDEPEEQTGGAILLRRAIASDIARRLQCPWTPPIEALTARWQDQQSGPQYHFHAASLSVPYNKGLDVAGGAEYISAHSRDLSRQPHDHRDVSASVLEHHQSELCEERDWETEWNRQGLASKLTPEEYKAKKRAKIHNKLSSHLSHHIEEAKRSEEADLNALLANLSQLNIDSKKTKGSRFTHTEKLQFQQEEVHRQPKERVEVNNTAKLSKEEVEEKRLEELSTLRENLQQLSHDVESLERKNTDIISSQAQMAVEFEKLKKSTTSHDDIYRRKKQTIDLLPDAEGNLERLQSLVASDEQKITNLHEQWDQHREPMMEKYEQLQQHTDQHVSEAQQHINEIEEMKELIQEATSELRVKDQLNQQLLSEFEKMAHTVNRSAYTRKILEIVANIRKQKEDIDKVLKDTRIIQKEINHLSGKLDRSFTVTDELIFKDAKKDESVRKSYKLLAALHENFNTLIKTIEDTGTVVREIRDLEDQIEYESKKKTQTNFKQISEDLQQMKKENAAMTAKLKKS